MQNINLLNFLGINYLLEFILLFLSTHPPPQYFKCKGTAVPSYGTASCVCSWSSLLCHFHSRTSLRLSLFSIQLHCQFKYETFSFNFQKNISNHASPSSFLSFSRCSVLSKEGSAFIPWALATAFGGRVCQMGPGRWGPMVHVCHRCAEELGRVWVRWGLLEQRVPGHPGQQATRILPRPKAQGHCIHCTRCHGAFSWIKRKWNVFTIVSKLSSNHSNQGFPQIWLTICSDQTRKSFSLSKCSEP